jgi:hypothetical protein
MNSYICFTCGKELQKDHKGPSGGLAFQALGNYGPTAHEAPMLIGIIVCDVCLTAGKMRGRVDELSLQPSQKKT